MQAGLPKLEHEGFSFFGGGRFGDRRVLRGEDGEERRRVHDEGETLVEAVGVVRHHVEDDDRVFRVQVERVSRAERTRVARHVRHFRF